VINFTEKMLYEGKAKRVWSTEKTDEVLIEFKDSLTAFNAQKKGSFEKKGEVNCAISELIFKELHNSKVKTHWIEKISETKIRVKNLKIIPLEVVVRNILAGSTAKKMGKDEGAVLKQPLVEFYFKNDELQDPFVSDDQILAFDIADDKTIVNLKMQALKINEILKIVMLKAQFTLVDFKIEFGKDTKGEIYLADEITPDCCRLWDVNTKEKFDKDRFRRDLGKVEESYNVVLSRLQEVVK
jgi:phosphoribosylaminoimidazole-succinocarboxamide synthase